MRNKQEIAGDTKLHLLQVFGLGLTALDNLNKSNSVGGYFTIVHKTLYHSVKGKKKNVMHWTRVKPMTSYLDGKDLIHMINTCDT